MKFTIERTVILTTTNSNGQLVKICEGDMVYLKLDLSNMDLSWKDKWIEKYPEGWVQGQITSISPKGNHIKFYIEPCIYFSLRQKDILDIKEI